MRDANALADMHKAVNGMRSTQHEGHDGMKSLKQVLEDYARFKARTGDDACVDMVDAIDLIDSMHAVVLQLMLTSGDRKVD